MTPTAAGLVGWAIGIAFVVFVWAVAFRARPLPHPDRPLNGELTMSYVYIRSEPRLWTVGFYKPDGQFEPESDHGNPDEAAERVAWLNGSKRED